MDYYKILEIEKDTSEEDIKKAYRKLALRYHPDKESGNTEKFQEIQKAYETLSDPEKKRIYDLGGNIDDNNIFDMFNNPFNNGFFKQGQGHMNTHTTKKMSDFNYVMNITLRDIYFGITKKLKIKRVFNICTQCNIKCNRCNGNGKIEQRIPMGPFQHIVQTNCHICNCNGYILKNECKCDKVEERIIEIVINRGDIDRIIKYNGWGEQIKSYNDKPGDFIVHIKILPDENFKRQNLDLIYNCKLTLKESLIGTKLKIPLFDGDFNFDIKGMGIINPKIEYKVFNKGLIDKNNDTGHLLLHFEIVYPERTFKESESEILNEVLCRLNII